MKTKLLLLFVVFATATNISITAKAQAVNVTDSLTLVDLYNSTNGPNWYNHDNWLTGPANTWKGIYVVGTRVIGIDLLSNNLTGTIPSSIGNLTSLERLVLAANHLQGSIPGSIGNLVNLTELSLNDNLKITGAIPSSIGNLVNLTSLQLYRNKLSGAIPSSIGNLTKLTVLYLYSNKLSGDIPAELGNLVNAYSFALSSNQLTGVIPASFSHLTGTKTLHLEENQLTGAIPPFLGNLDLDELYLNDNQLSGSLPSSLGRITNLTALFLNNNQLSGSIPDSIGMLTNLFYLYLSGNQLSGPIPPSIGNCSELLHLYLSNNQLSGTIPSSLINLKHLTNLYVSHNLLSQNSNIHFSNSQNEQTTADVSYNRFNFNGLEYLANSFASSVYSPQAIVPIHQNNAHLSVSAGGRLRNNTYRWFRVGSTDTAVIKGDSTFSPMQTGLYYARIKNTIANKLTLTTDTVSYTMPLVKKESIVSLSIYPNPVRDVLNLTGLHAGSLYTITISDASGYVWLTGTAKQQSTAMYNVGRLKPGYYLLHVSTANEKSELKFVKE